MDKYKTRPKAVLISEGYHTNFNENLNKKLAELWADGAEIYEIKPFSNDGYVFALIIFS